MRKGGGLNARVREPLFDFLAGNRPVNLLVVADNLEQICSIGDTHHAIVAELMRKEDVYTELGEIVAGKKAGRTSEAEIIVFDSTGVAIEDAAAATLVYEKALTAGLGNYFAFAA